MTTLLSTSRLTSATSVVVASLALASCQTGADEFLAMGDAATTVTSTTGQSGTSSTYEDPLVVAMAGKTAPSAAGIAVQADSPAPTLKRTPSPMAAAYADIAEPPPEVLAQQNAKMGSSAPQRPAPSGQTANLGELTMQETGVRAGSNSIFSAGRNPAPLPDSQGTLTGQDAASTSLVPSDLPVVGVRAATKSLFSPTVLPTAPIEPAAQPVAPSGVIADEGEPVLHKLSDPRPKRKMLALREPAQQVPQNVQMTEAQLLALGAIPETQMESATDAVPAKGKKSWMPSLSKLLSGGAKAKTQSTAP